MTEQNSQRTPDPDSSALEQLNQRLQRLDTWLREDHVRQAEIRRLQNVCPPILILVLGLFTPIVQVQVVRYDRATTDQFSVFGLLGAAKDGAPGVASYSHPAGSLVAAMLLVVAATIVLGVTLYWTARQPVRWVPNLGRLMAAVGIVALIWGLSTVSSSGVDSAEVSLRYGVFILVGGHLWALAFLAIHTEHLPSEAPSAKTRPSGLPRR